jgi:hypothetical protein
VHQLPGKITPLFIKIRKVVLSQLKTPFRKTGIQSYLKRLLAL